MGWLERYRRSRGFGVHSPFAFRFITEVLGEKLPYYDYERLPEHRDRLLYRVACRFQPERVCAPEAMLRVIRMAVPQSQASTVADADFLAFDADPGIDALLKEGRLLACENPRRKVIFLAFKRHKALIEAISAHLKEQEHGMIFDNDRTLAIIVLNPKLPQQLFHVKF